MTEGPTPRRNLALRTRLMLLAAAAIVPLALMSGLGLLLMVQQQRQQAERSALDLTRAMAIAVDAELQRTVAALEVLSTAASLDTGDLQAFMVRVQRVVAQQSGWQLALLADPQGRVLLNTAYPDGGALPPMAEQESFAQVVQSRQAVIGLLKRGYRGQFALPVRVPVMRDGQLRYVLTAVLRPEAIASVLQRQRIPNDWLVSVFDAKGLRVARSRGAERFIGMPAAPSLQALIARHGDEGTGVTTSLEGEEIHTAYTRLRSSGWMVAIGVPSSAVYAGISQSLAAYGGGLLLSLLLGGLAALLVSRGITRPIRSLHQAAQALGQGRVPQVQGSSIRELQDVADALHASAQLQQAGAAERARLYEQAQAARQQAEAANRSKDEFLAMLGHELRNPLAPIVTALRLMALRNGDAHQAERRILERQVAHLTRLVDDLLDVSRFARGKVQLQRELLDLREVIGRALEIAQPLLAHRDQPVRVDLPPEPVFVFGDAVRLAQVFSNLLSNAAKFTPPQARIAVRTLADSASITVTVEDGGAGIPADLLPRVFDLFVQGQQALDRQAGGLGLGLAIVKTLVELHGGSVSAHSEGEGRGARFSVRLPRATAAAATSAPLPAQRTVAGAPGKRILVVDDNLDAADTLALVLGTFGHQVRTAASGPQALALLDTFVPEVAVLDIGLPGMDGYTLARQLKHDDRVPGLRLLALTGYGHELDRAKALAAGFDDHFVKPAAVEDLLAAIERLFAAPA
ncbi:ATP-binding protein [Ideonella sp. BN130291]|uniref:ATP-binding protein n=1 Tax=Ideonella sp. BN130291 TaxID=3112940 RepID=UPI002E268995|nr:ATP-binding protein [Ideonella sp. BN130291]